MTETIHKESGMRSISQVIDFIRNKSSGADHVHIKSDKIDLNIPIGEKDVMCMKVLKFIKDEYGDHTVGESIEVLQDSIWWFTTFMVAFPPKDEAK